MSPAPRRRLLPSQLPSAGPLMLALALAAGCGDGGEQDGAADAGADAGSGAGTDAGADAGAGGACGALLETCCASEPRCAGSLTAFTGGWNDLPCACLSPCAVTMCDEAATLPDTGDALADVQCSQITGTDGYCFGGADQFVSFCAIGEDCTTNSGFPGECYTDGIGLLSFCVVSCTCAAYSSCADPEAICTAQPTADGYTGACVPY